ncbi:MAG: peptidoglycan-binding protein [Hyphomicrobiaceae bacterium]|nr:peptidoglycan-binding protein [Hyphomicrobiaceae bacterium]
MKLRVRRIGIVMCMAMSFGVLINILALQGTKNAARAFNYIQDHNNNRMIVDRALNRLDSKINLMRSDAEELPGLVRAVQRELKENKYYGGKIDGNLSLHLRAAIMDYEAENQLPLTGEVSEEILRAILLGASLETRPVHKIQLSHKAQTVLKYVQKLLKQIKFGNLRNFGQLDVITVNAIQQFELEHQLPAKGRISYNLILKLEEVVKAKVIQQYASSK